MHVVKRGKLTKEELSLLKAVEDEDQKKVRALLKKYVDPDFRDPDGMTPLVTAVRYGNFGITMDLVKAGADINMTADGWGTPLDAANALQEETIAQYLISEGAKRKRGPKSSRQKTLDETLHVDGTNMPAATPEEQKGPVFKADTLKDIFNPESWVGKTEEMENLWEEVPKHLKKKFDFVAALAQAQRETVRRHYSKKIPPLKNGPPTKP